MRTFSIGLALALTATASDVAAACTPQKDDPAVSTEGILISAEKSPPPGMVFVEGGKALIGSKPKDLEELLQTPSYQGYKRTLDGETPQHKVTVGPFFIGKYEVTNEQYLEFVKATGHRPPEHWGQEAIFAAQTEFGRLEAEKVKAAKERDEKYTRRKWTERLREEWWSKNWKEAEWSIPEGLENRPVVFTNYQDARAYANWSGMRLPTEQEWIRAARGDEEQWFPWGNEWEAKGRAHTTELQQQKLFPIGSFPNGASPFGVMDMAGSVWEWTTSPYRSYPKYKTNKFKVKKTGSRKKEILEVTPVWDANQRVVMGGAFQFGLLAARVTTRRATDRTQTADGLGIRIAVSATPARDKVESIWENVIQNATLRGNGESFDRNAVVGLDRWTANSATVEGKRPEGYAFATRYEHIAFVPRNELDLAAGPELRTESRITPVLFGYFTTTVPFADPPLAPGEYIVAYRGKGTIITDRNAADSEEETAGEGAEGEGEKPKDEDEIPLELLTPEQRMLRQIDLQENLLIFMDATTSEYVASIKTSKPVDKKDKKDIPNGVALERKSVWVGETARDRVKEIHDTLTFDVKVRRTAKSRVLPVQIQMRVENDMIGKGWRRAEARP
ncbi:MAG: SUMF1/EgtB/PvdO family nonheme iron enzyme [Planctomycetota bacterium]